MEKEMSWVTRKTGLLLTGLVLVLGMTVLTGCEHPTTSPVFPPITAPATPAGLQVTAASSTSITISWTAVTGAVSYKVYRSAVKDGTYEAVDNPVDTSSTDTGLQSDTTYWYKVTALNGRGESGQSIAISAATTTTSGGGGDGGGPIPGSFAELISKSKRTNLHNPLNAICFNDSLELMYCVGMVKDAFIRASTPITKPVNAGPILTMGVTDVKGKDIQNGVSRTYGESLGVGFTVGFNEVVVATVSLNYEVSFSKETSTFITESESAGTSASMPISIENDPVGTKYAMAYVADIYYYQTISYDLSKNTWKTIGNSCLVDAGTGRFEAITAALNDYMVPAAILPTYIRNLSRAELIADLQNVNTKNSKIAQSITLNDGGNITCYENSGAMYTGSNLIGLDFTVLKAVGFKTIKIDGDFDAKVSWDLDKGDGRDVWLEVDGIVVWQQTYNIDSLNWRKKNFSKSDVPIAAFTNGSQVRFGFRTKDIGFFSNSGWNFGTAHVTFTELK